MGNVIFDLPPDAREQLELSDPGRLVEIDAATREFGPHLSQAVRDVLETEQGGKTIAGALSDRRSKDNAVYVFVDPTQNDTSGAAITRRDGYSSIKINPCDGLSSYITPEGETRPFTLRDVITHEMEHINRGHHQSSIAKMLRTENFEEGQAIRATNSVRAEFGREPRIDGNYQESAVMPDGLVDFDQCGPTTFSDVRR